MNLQFLIPACPGFGVYQLDSSSYHSMVNINSSLDLIYSICRRFALIPLSLRLVEKEVKPEGQNKTVRVLNLVPTYSLAETQKLAQFPPEQALVLPPPDSEAPDDIFPNEVVGKEKGVKDSTDVNKELILLWDKAKSKVWHLDILDSQIASWFKKHYRLEARLKDFQSVEPPAKFTAEQLSHFIEAIEFHAKSF